MAKSVDAFKKLLKTHLFSEAFHSWVYVSDLPRFFKDVLFCKAFYSQVCFYTDVILIYHLAIYFFSMHCCNTQLIVSSCKLLNISYLTIIKHRYFGTLNIESWL